MVRFLIKKDIPKIQKIEMESLFEISNMVEDDELYALGVFTNEKQLVGFCSCGCADTFSENNEYNNDIALSDLYILESERGKGYAGELIKETIRYAKEQTRRIILDLWNDDVEELYRKYGFVHIDGTDSMIYK